MMPGIGYRSTEMVSKVTALLQNEQGADSPFPKVSRSHCLRTRREYAEPLELVLLVPRLVVLIPVPACSGQYVVEKRLRVLVVVQTQQHTVPGEGDTGVLEISQTGLLRSRK